jgi:mRNA-degrading endonuclease RelE of RelBE toxin-antitoxin system
LHPEAVRELKGVPAFHRRAIVEMMETVLTNDPTTERKSRVKRMKAGFHPPYRLRVGEYRVYYDVDVKASSVTVLHVWRKGRTQTPVSGQED